MREPQTEEEKEYERKGKLRTYEECKPYLRCIVAALIFSKLGVESTSYSQADKFLTRLQEEISK